MELEVGKPGWLGLLPMAGYQEAYRSKWENPMILSDKLLIRFRIRKSTFQNLGTLMHGNNNIL